jgi:hyperosmotically inducible periplasmic protein
MRIRLATGYVLMATLMASVMAAHAADSDTDRSNPMTYLKDSAITARIKAQLAAVHPTSLIHLQVDTDDAGVVWLSGNTSTKEAADQAVAIAAATEGVKSVNSEIVVKGDL